MSGRIDSGLGQIVIDTDVIATYAGSVAVECFGIVGMAAVSVKDGLVKLLRKDSLKHGISVNITDENKICLNFHVIVAYGVSIIAVSDNLISNVKYKVENFTLVIEDTGIGIPKEDIDRIFERFYRVDKSHSNQKEGSGLGLSIVKHGAKFHHAEMEVESEVGKGTKITVVFPRQNSDL